MAVLRNRIPWKRQAKTEAKLQDSVQTTDNPFDEGKTIVGLGNKRKKNRQQNKFQKIKERIEKEKEPDIRKELKKGNTVEIIEDRLDY
jgi:hypothetical protein